MVNILIVSLGLQIAPAELPGVIQIKARLLIAEHIHALVREQFLGDVLVADLGLDLMNTAPPREIQRLVAGVIGRRSHLIQGQGMPDAARGPRGLEVATGLVVLRLRQGATVGDAEAIGGRAGPDIDAVTIAVALVVAADRALEQVLLVGGGEFRLGRVRDDGAADAVARQAHGHDAGIDLETADRRRVEIGQGGIHVVGTGGDQVHAIDLDAHPIIGQAMNGRQTGDTAGPIEADARHLEQELGGIAGADSIDLQGAARHDTGTGEGPGRLGTDDDFTQFGRAFGAGPVPGRRHGTGDRHGGG